MTANGPYSTSPSAIAAPTGMILGLLRPRLRAVLLGLLVVPTLTMVLYLRSTSSLPDSPLPGQPLAYHVPLRSCVGSGDQMPSAGERLKAWFGWTSSTSSSSWSSNDWAESDFVPTSGIERYMASHLSDLQSSYDPEHDLVEYGLKTSNISLPIYISDLLDTYRTYLASPTSFFSASTSQTIPAYLSLVLSRLSLRPPGTQLPECPKQVMTTDKSVDDLPDEFARWKEIMPDWQIRYFDDEGLREWVGAAFGGAKAEGIWESLPRQVLKTDVFRRCWWKEESIPTAAPIIPTSKWGRPYRSGTPPLLTHLTRLLSLSTSSNPSEPATPESEARLPDVDLLDTITASLGHSEVYDAPLIEDGAELGEPALVVSVEADAIDFGWDNWRELSMARAVQFTQWTFMARPGHPVFLDALGRTLRKSEEVARLSEEAVETGEEYTPESALEWTGPGVFTDCVYRYLLARYGFQPSDLIHQKVPIRVGDVLILPAGSFSSVSPFTGEQQRPWAAVFHGFLGRWREADPAQHEKERLKKLKDEGEANGEHAQAEKVGEELEKLMETSQEGQAK